MGTESHSAPPDRGTDPLVRELLSRLATPARQDGVGNLVRESARSGHGFLPDLPDSRLLALLSAYHRRGVQVGFPELMTAPA
ncbi:hypothetical protein [Streptomyces olivochromogenes]|uniref:hypothetical protein n=1 Tax=Streptomyces olivochromogenes TaxID=1963 RepID=UPI001F371780|nr:hypothetical protein [Streptomyces olivochromogenes]MCF3137064.1 hypothetical protein [Streptomyces olivochromogenes]